MIGGLWIAAAFILSAPAEPSRVAGDPSAPPREDGRPIEVGIGFHVVDFSRITAREESFDVTVHMMLRWRDPRLADGAGDVRRIWVPRVNFDNAAESPKAHGEPFTEIAPDGWVTSKSILTGKFSTPLDLRRFPFDSQELVVRISLADDENQVRFTPIAEQMHMHDDAFISDWTFTDQTFQVKTRRYRPGGDVYSMLEYQVEVKRRSTFYVWRVLLPLTLLSLIPWLVFWFEPLNLQPQISTCMGTLIAMLTFGYSVDFALPKVAYLTAIDRHAMIGFLFATAATIAVAIVHQWVAKGDAATALKIQRKLRLFYPIAYFLAVAVSLAELEYAVAAPEASGAVPPGRSASDR